MLPITDLNGKDHLKIRADFYIPSSQTTDLGFGLECIGSNHSGGGYFIQISPNNCFRGHKFNNNRWVSNTYWEDKSASADTWYTIEIEVNGTNLTIKYYDASETLLTSTTFNLTSISSNFSTLADRGYGIVVGYVNGTRYGYCKNIQVWNL